MTQIPKKRIFYSFLVIEISNLEFTLRLLRVVSPSTLLRTVSQSNGLSNHL
jgi:hypothetical protein